MSAAPPTPAHASVPPSPDARVPRPPLFRVALISTGGTIEKTFDELHGVLHNRVSVLDAILASLEIEGVAIERVPLMNKDSLEMTEADHDLIAATAAGQAARHDGVVIVHGTDRLTRTGERIHGLLFGAGAAAAPATGPAPLPHARKPIVLTGAMRPYELRRTDAVQNLTEALLAVQIVPPGVYVAMHNQVLAFPGVRKDYERMTFTKP
jgi:L-asparaginase